MIKSFDNLLNQRYQKLTAKTSIMDNIEIKINCMRSNGIAWHGIAGLGMAW